MKRYTTLLALALTFFVGAFNTSALATVTHMETVYGDDLEYVTSDAGAFTSYHWEAFLYVQDDAEGSIFITWYAYDGYHYAIYSVDANAANWTLIGGEQTTDTASQVYLSWYLL